MKAYNYALTLYFAVVISKCRVDLKKYILKLRNSNSNNCSNSNMSYRESSMSKSQH